MAGEGEEGKYTQVQIDTAKVKAGAGVTLLALISIWITSKLVRWRRNRQGVRQI